MSAAYLHRSARGRLRPRHGSGLALPVMVVAGFAAVAISYVAYALWPRWPGTPVAPNAAALPITVAGVAFNLPPGAIRVPIQRRPGAQERVDLVFLWPSLDPPDPVSVPAIPTKGAPRPKPLERIFVTIAAMREGLSPHERLKTIYPRYVEEAPAAGPDGLAVLAFRAGTPYQGEDLVYDGTAPDNFLVRCSRNGAGPTPGICLHSSRVGAADVTLRFPRDWLEDWRPVAAGLTRLMGKLRPADG